MNKLPQSHDMAVTAVRAEQEIRSRFNPLRGLTPQRVTLMLEDLNRGVLRYAAWMMERVERSDYIIKTVAPKRRKALSRLDWSISAYESWEDLGSEKQLHEQTRFLRSFFNSLRVTHALERNTLGGLRLLIAQMADAIGKKHAVHEVIWSIKGDQLSAKLVQVPLWFFESQTGKLRFLKASGSARDGDELDEGRWMITTGDGLMEACLICYVYKTLPLKDWLTYSERCGMPFPSMATDAAPGSKDWHDALQAVASVGAEYGAVHSRNADFQVHDLTVRGELPYPPLVERMDRAMTTLWRGADLSTMSGEDQMGASLQQGESDLLVEDDVQMINETIEQYLSLPALRWRFGEDVEPMVYFRLAAPDRRDDKAEQEKLHKAADYGVSVPVSDYRERLAIPGGGGEDEDAVLQPPERSAEPESQAARRRLPVAADTANEDPDRASAIARLATALAFDRADILSAIGELESAADSTAYADALERLRELLANREYHPDHSAYASALEEILSEALVEGATDTLKTAL